MASQLVFCDQDGREFAQVIADAPAVGDGIVIETRGPGGGRSGFVVTHVPRWYTSSARTGDRVHLKPASVFVGMSSTGSSE